MNSSRNTIIEKYLEDYPIPVTLRSTETIVWQMKSSICKIYLNNGNKGTGFFCKIPFPDYNHFKSFLITNNHVIDESQLKKENSFDIAINNDTINKKIFIGERMVYTSKLYDTTIIEIYEDKDNIQNFLQLDFDINENNFDNKYINKSIYILQYPNHDKAEVSYGIIKNIDLTKKYDIYHYCSTQQGSSGSPILNTRTNKLIGIHKGACNNFNFNKGTLLIYPFKEFISEMKSKSFLIINTSIKKEKIEAMKKIKEEYKLILDNPLTNFGCSVGLKNPNNLFEWKCTILGPKDTSYKGGIFILDIKFPDNYPIKPPKIAFRTPIYHANINPRKPSSPNGEELGNICISTLNWWKPEFTMIELLSNIYGLFYMVNPDNPYGLDRAYEIKNNRKLYEEKIKYFTKKYANPNVADKKYNESWDFSYP